MSADCQRWIELADQAAAGEHLAETDLEWLSHHARVCGECRAEKQFYDSLRDALGRPERLLVPSHATASPVRRSSSRRPLWFGLSLAAGLALAVGGYQALRSARSPSAVPTPAVAAQVLFASGEALLGPLPAEVGQRISQGERLSTSSGSACLAIADSIDVCLDGASAARLALGDSNQIVVYLEKGTLMAKLAHQPAGRKFLVRTAGAEVQAVGTRFSVRLADGGNTRVRLYEGRLAVRAASRISTDLVAPVEAGISEDILVAPIAVEATGEDKPLAQLLDVTHSGRGTSLVLTSTPAGADVLLDNVAIGKTPISMLLVKAAHVRLSLSGYQPISEWVEPGDGSRIERGFTLNALPASGPKPSEPSPRTRHAASQVSADQLLAKAQSLRARGEYKGCEQLYRRLWSEFPGSEAAKVSMISLGELELVHAKNPGAALEAFNAYLRTGGPLEREARFGKIRALRAFDRHEEADAETSRFLRDYPTSIHAATLRRNSYGR